MFAAAVCFFSDSAVLLSIHSFKYEFWWWYLDILLREVGQLLLRLRLGQQK